MPADKDKKAAKPEKVVLGYWADIHGIVEPIRYMLEYLGVPYEYKTYPWMNKPTLQESKAVWLEEKKALAAQGFAFPNLPYLVDGETKMTQSLAIMRYLARKHGLVVPDSKPVEAARVDMLESLLNDLRWSLIYYCWEDYLESLKWNFVEALPGQVEQLSRALGDRPWLAGDKITHVDFLLYELLDQFSLFKPGCLDKHDNLKAYVDRFRQLKLIKAYLSSDRFRPWPMFLPLAKRWGSGKPPASIASKVVKA
uniref:glutathione transferase n=1 Tax=Amblyomma maculatum TaxID=34609 RepID=G3MR73_AMBMU